MDSHRFTRVNSKKGIFEKLRKNFAEKMVTNVFIFSIVGFISQALNMFPVFALFTVIVAGEVR
jgi:hypothetical protein